MLLGSIYLESLQNGLEESDERSYKLVDLLLRIHGQEDKIARPDNICGKIRTGSFTKESWDNGMSLVDWKREVA